MEVNQGMTSGYLFEMPTAEPAETKQRKASGGQQIFVSGEELAEYLCLSAPAVTKMKNAGLISVGANGKYPLKESIQAYIGKKIKTLSRKKTPEEEEDLDRVEQLWDIENKKTKNKTWREQYAMDIAAIILRKLYATASNFAKGLTVGSKEEMNIRAILDAIGEIDAQDVLCEKEGSDDASEY